MTHSAETSRFAVYPDAGQSTPLSIAYCTLGLVEESDELLKAIVLDNGQQLAEAGDVAWYIASLRREAGLEQSEPGDKVVAEAQRPAAEWASTVCSLAAVVAGRAKRVLRDNMSPATLAEPLDDLHWALERTVVSLGSTLPAVRDMNLAKLSARQANGTIHGSGDNR